MIKNKSFVLLSKHNQIQQGNADGRDRRNKSLATTCNEEEVFYIYIYIYIYFFFLMLPLSAINHPLFYFLPAFRVDIASLFN